MKRLVLLIVGFGMTLSASAQTYEFKGVKLASKATLSEVEAKLGVICKAGAERTACAGASTMMSLPANINVEVVGGVVSRIDVDFDKLLFDEAAQSLQQRYGKPYGRKESMVVWRNKRGDLVILQRDGLLSLASAEDQRRSKAAVDKAKKDF